MDNSLTLIKEINDILFDLDISDNQFMQSAILEKNQTLLISFSGNFTDLIQHFLFDNTVECIDINYIIENGITNTYTNTDYSTTLFYHNIYLIFKNINLFNNSFYFNTFFSTILDNLAKCEESYLYLLSNELDAQNIFLACNYLKHKISFVLALNKNKSLKKNQNLSCIFENFVTPSYFNDLLALIFNPKTTNFLEVFFDMNNYDLDFIYSHSNFRQLLKDLDSLLVLRSFNEDEQDFLKTFIHSNFLEKIDDFKKERGLVPFQKQSLLKKLIDKIIDFFHT